MAPGERARRNLEINLDYSDENGPEEWASLTIKQPNGTPFATIRLSLFDLERAVGAILGGARANGLRDQREAAILNRNADRLNAETAEVMEFQREP
jgi:hypothetical protein